MDNDTVRDLHCVHPCREYEKGMEEEEEECTAHKLLDGSRGKAPCMYNV